MKNLCILLSLIFLSCLCRAAAPVVSSFTPVSAVTGMTVTITGSSFTGATSVSFGATAAGSFTVVSATQITAVVASGTSGLVQVTTAGGSGSKAGFTYVLTSGIITDFGGYWPSTGANPNATVPDSSHNLLAFTFNGNTYSTGVNNTILNNKSVSYIDGSYKALPVTSISGVTAATSTYLALAKKVDGSSATGNTPAVSGYSIRTALTDGPNGLNLGTGVTNLPASAVLNFPVFNINSAAITDDVPDILLTQIAQPVAGNDLFSFVDAGGAVVGNSITQDMTSLPLFGTYGLDLFNLTPSTPYNAATAYSAFSVNTTREIRLVGFRLSDFGITISNAAQVKALKITPSGNSDYAFIAYNANALNMPPNVSQNDAATNVAVCSGGTANLTVLAGAAGGGSLSYSWQESADGGSTWTTIINGGNYSGATTAKLSVAGAMNAYLYKAIVHEAGNANDGTSPVFTIAVSAPSAPTAVSVTGATTCLNTVVQLSASVTGGSNLFYKWQSNAAGPFTDIPDAVLNNYTPPVNQTGAISYRVTVSSGSGCATLSSTAATITVTGIATTVPASVCTSGPVTLAASTTSGSINWYDADAAGTLLTTNTSYTTPSLSTSTTYYLVSSACPSALRVPITATVYPVSAGGVIAGSTTVVPGINSTDLNLSGYTGNVLKWQSSTDAFSADINDIANSTPKLTVSNLSQTTQFRTLVQSGSCAASFSSAAIISVNAALPISNKSVSCVKQGQEVLIQWTAYNQQNTVLYEVEKSVDAARFTGIGTITVHEANDISVNYKWIDPAPKTGNNYYRIREVLRSDFSDYSSIVSVYFAEGPSGMRVYPNPVTGKLLHLQLNNMAAGIYQLKLLNGAGQLVYHAVLHHDGITPAHTLQLPGIVSTGTYNLQLDGSKHSNATVVIR